jgi:LacI family transcriptional regulator
MPGRRKPISIAEVARHAGVSPATVSRVLTGQRRHVAADTRRRVLAAATRLDYSPNALARSLVTRRTPIIAAIVHDISDPYFGDMTRGIESVAGERDYLVMVCNWLRDPHRLLRHLRLLKAMRVAGVVFCGSGLTEDQPLSHEIAQHIRRLRRYGVRMAALAPQSVEMPAVMVDNHAAGVLAVRHLVAHGHRRIGHLAGPLMLLTARHRYEGYRQALAEAGIAAEPAWVEPAGFHVAEGYEGARRLLSRAPEITAIFASNDQVAAGAMAAACEMGRRIPDTLSLVGIGNVPMAAFLRPALTTVAVPTMLLGQEGARLLLDGRTRRAGGPPVRFLPVELVVRESVAGPAADAANQTRMLR